MTDFKGSHTKKQEKGATSQKKSLNLNAAAFVPAFLKKETP